MPARKFSLQSGGPADLVVSWKRAFKETKVFCQGELMCSFPERQELEDGGHVELPDGSDLVISLSRGELVLLREGMPVPGSTASAHNILKHGVYAFNAMALITVLLGAYVVYSINDMDYLSDSVIFAIVGFLFVLCGFLTGKGKKPAAYGGLVLSFFYVWFWVVFIANHFNNIAALMFLMLHVYLIMKVIKAIPAIRRFNMYVMPE